MIWGEAGIGKSTFCQKLSQDWALAVTGRNGTELDKLGEEQRRKLHNIGLLFYIVLRDTNSDQTLDQILTSQLGLTDRHLEMLKSYKGNVTLLLDGFDELSYNTGHLIELIQGKLVHSNACIITCRPHASQGIVLNSDSEIKLKGFSESQSKAFIEMFARNRFKKEKDVELFILKTWKEITSSVDLLEMSTNPSMLQLICILSVKTGKIGKDRAEVFKHYTRYLLIQYHTKHCERVPFSEDIYKNSLLKSGKLAIFGLKQNHLQLVFSKAEAKQIAGSAIFDLGFLTELPSIDPDRVNVQFIHKSLQEYLAAFYVVNTPGNEGMKLLMEFSSTSQRLMGSQIILSFIAAMSKKLGKVIQSKVKDYISAWQTNDDVDPKSRTSFLMAMLKDNKKLTFPLPAILDIDLQDYDSVTGRIVNFIKSLFGQKSTLDRFMNMDGRGVKKMNIGVGQYNRLGLLLNNSFPSMEELLINYKNSWSKDDPTDLSQVIRTNKPRLISITSCVDSLFNKDIITKVILTPHVHTVILKKCQISKDNCLFIIQRGHHLKSLIIQESGIKINAEITKAVCDLSDETQIDLSGNEIFKMNTKLLASLINKINTQKQIDLSGLNIDIHSEIAKAVCDLPDETQIDLSGNKITKMDKKLLVSLIHKIRKQKQIDLGAANIDIDSEIAKAVCDLPDETQIDLSGNKLTKMDKKLLISLIHKIRRQKQIDLGGANIDIDSEIAKAVCDLPDETQIDLSGNKITKMDKKLLISLIHKIRKQKQIDLRGANIDICSKIAKAVCDLPDETQIDLSGNKITKMDKKLLISLIHKIRKQKQIDLGGANIDIDSEIAKAVCDLPDETQIDLSGNKITKMDKKLLISLIHKIRKQKQIDLRGANIDICSKIAKAVCDLPDETQIDLSGNKIVKMETIILTSLINKIRTQKQIDLERINIQINNEIAKAVCNLPDETEIVLSGNTTVKIDTKILITLISKVRIETEVDLSGLYIRVDDKEACVIWETQDKTHTGLCSNKVLKINIKKFMSVIYKITTQKEINLSGLYIDIDSEIAKAVCDLPDETQIDLSGNKIVKMGKKLLISLIHKIRKQKEIDLGGANIDIDSEIAQAVCELPDETQIDLSGNKIVQMETVILTSLINKIRTQKQIDLERINIQINTEIAKTVCDLSDETQIVLSGDTTVKIDTKILITLINKVRIESETDLSGLYIRVGDREACVIWDIQAETQTDLYNNKIVEIDIKKFLLFIYKTTTKKEINLSGFNIDIDSELIKCISELKEDVQIDLSDNKITDKSLIVSIIKQSTKLKSVTMRNCGIKINKQIAEAVSELNDDTKLDLSGNKITKLKAGLLVKVLKYMKTQEKISIYDWGIRIDVDIVKALSNMVYLKYLNLSFNTFTPSASKYLSQSVRSLPQLEGLVVFGCDISNDDCVGLVSSLSKHCHRLWRLDLYNNHLSSGYSQVVDDVSKMNNLRELGLLGNPCMEDRKKREEIKNRLMISNPYLTVN